MEGGWDVGEVYEFVFLGVCVCLSFVVVCFMVSSCLMWWVRMLVLRFMVLFVFFVLSVVVVSVLGINDILNYCFDLLVLFIVLMVSEMLLMVMEFL